MDLCCVYDTALNRLRHTHKLSQTLSKSVWCFCPLPVHTVACSHPGSITPWLIRPLACSPYGLFAPWLFRPLTLDVFPPLNTGNSTSRFICNNLNNESQVYSMENKSKLARHRERISQGANKPGGESARGQTSQKANRQMGKKAIIQSKLHK